MFSEILKFRVTLSSVSSYNKGENKSCVSLMFINSSLYSGKSRSRRIDYGYILVKHITRVTLKV